MDPLINCATVAKSSAQEATSVHCEQSSENTGKLIGGSMQPRQRCRKPCDFGSRGMSIEGLIESVWPHGPTWLQQSEDKWTVPWCQENEFEPMQNTSTTATEAKLDQYLTEDDTVNRTRNVFAYCMRFKTKEKGAFKADEIHQADQILFRFV